MPIDVKHSQGRQRATRLDRRTRAARAEGREARDELLAAALKVFARRGYRQGGAAASAAAGALEARARHLGTPDLPMPAEDVARIVMSIIGGLSVDELIEPGSVRADLLGDTLALIYAGLVARARDRAAP